MRWKSHVRFWGEGEGVILLPYPTTISKKNSKRYRGALNTLCEKNELLKKYLSCWGKNYAGNSNNNYYW